MAGIFLTREQLERWSGRTLTLEDLERLDECIPNSSIPEAIDCICDGADIGTPDDEFEADPEWVAENKAEHAAWLAAHNREAR